MWQSREARLLTLVAPNGSDVRGVAASVSGHVVPSVGPWGAAAYLVFARLALPPQDLVDVGARGRVLQEVARGVRLAEGLEVVHVEAAKGNRVEDGPGRRAWWRWCSAISFRVQAPLAAGIRHRRLAGRC